SISYRKFALVWYSNTEGANVVTICILLPYSLQSLNTAFPRPGRAPSSRHLACSWLSERRPDQVIAAPRMLRPIEDSGGDPKVVPAPGTSGQAITEAQAGCNILIS